MARTTDETTPTSRKLDLPPCLQDVDEDDLDAEQSRIYKARTEPMLVLPQTSGDSIGLGYPTGLYYVVRPTGSVYMVDLEEAVPTCECPDYRFNAAAEGVFCKHAYHVDRAIRETSLPAPDAADLAYPIEDVLAILEVWWDEFGPAKRSTLERVIGDHPDADCL